jgi:hypothetical protein
MRQQIVKKVELVVLYVKIKIIVVFVILKVILYLMDRKAVYVINQLTMLSINLTHVSVKVNILKMKTIITVNSVVVF